jgi:hypothetical protein
MSATIRWRVPPEILASNLGTYIERLKAALFDLCRLTARAFRVGAGVVIYLFHTMSYGIFLEVKNQGRFAIILRTLEQHYAPLMSALRQLAGGH